MAHDKAIHINRVAETHFMIKPMLEGRLKQQVFTPEGKELYGPFNNYYEFWVETLGDRFFDMGTLIRLASAVEISLQEYYMSRKRFQTRTELKADPAYKKNIFQRLQTWNRNDSAIYLYREELNLDLETIPEIREIRELMLHRHLYVHNAGILDQEYIDKMKQLTGNDLMQNPTIFPEDDTYYFEPLKRINDYIEASRRFVRKLP